VDIVASGAGNKQMGNGESIAQRSRKSQKGGERYLVNSGDGGQKSGIFLVIDQDRAGG
jgi:hypothetical protein